MATDEEILAAKAEFERALVAYSETINAGEFVTGWVVLTQRTSIELEQSNRSAVGMIIPNGQSFALTRGLLELGIDLDKRSRHE